MAYDYDEMISIYLVIHESKKDTFNDDIVAWSKEKDLAKFYLQFHNCKNLKLKKYKDYPKNILNNVINNHINTEIKLANLRTYNEKGKETILVAPVTDLEMTELHEFTGVFCDTLIDYRSIHKLLGYFKKKYQKALGVILLPLIVNFVLFVGEKTFTSRDKGLDSYLANQITIDEIKMLYFLEEDLFG